jgi:undecaprenyl-diphosphatase
LNYLVKLIVRRPRPVLEGLPPLGGAPSSLSFPSAHATSSFAVATAMFRVDPATAGVFVVAIVLSLGRPYLGMHYPSDVLAGALLGLALGLVVPLSL